MWGESSRPATTGHPAAWYRNGVPGKPLEALHGASGAGTKFMGLEPVMGLLDPADANGTRAAESQPRAVGIWPWLRHVVIVIFVLAALVVGMVLGGLVSWLVAAGVVVLAAPTWSAAA